MTRDSCTVAPAQEWLDGKPRVLTQRRKTLRAALARWAGSPDAAELILREAGVDPSARGESLTVAEFTRIAQVGKCRKLS